MGLIAVPGLPPFHFLKSWPLTKIELFMKHFMNITVCKNVSELKNHILPQCVWVEMEKVMDEDADILKEMWRSQLHMQFFCPDPIRSNDLRIKLIRFMYDNKIFDPKGKWSKIAAYFDGYTTLKLGEIYRSLMKIAKKNCSTAEESLEYLYTVYIPMIKNSPYNRMLPRLRFQEGKVEYVEEDLIEMSAYEIESEVEEE
ncbi:hypothetical protein TKK_0001930 [Trichogramma kaykai]|uniref:ARID domain-containing protein n=1 Tax=Trichogramma kaykai TaxID=54128 RepID=A0ABD2X8E6_9HYME